MRQSNCDRGGVKVEEGIQESSKFSDFAISPITKLGKRLQIGEHFWDF